ncbi:MAG TPA: PH domain-containing protein [Mycobacteriales bacterium]|nr:PH domain-containing protein [Mycobacteriales bacterium]
MTDRLVVRPRRLRLVCWALSALVVVISAVVATALRTTTEGAAAFRVGDQIALFLLGVLLAGAVLLFTRAKVEADPYGIRVRNPVGDITLPWQVVAAVRLDDGAPWATLDLHDDDTVAILAVQANDGEAAIEAVLALRRLLAASRQSS